MGSTSHRPALVTLAALAPLSNCAGYVGDARDPKSRSTPFTIRFGAWSVPMILAASVLLTSPLW